MAMTFATDVNTNGYTLKANKVSAPTTSGGTTYGLGTSGNVLKSNGSSCYWGTDAGSALTPSSAIAIPSSGVSVSKNMSGITADYVLVAWRFSSSAENAPPVNLSWATYSGYFTITNNGGVTSESVQPVFALPTAIVVTDHT